MSYNCCYNYILQVCSTIRTKGISYNYILLDVGPSYGMVQCGLVLIEQQNEGVTYPVV